MNGLRRGEMSISPTFSASTDRTSDEDTSSNNSNNINITNEKKKIVDNHYCSHHHNHDDNDFTEISDIELKDKERMDKMTDAVRTLLTCIGEDITRPGILDTPERMSKALLYFTKGYRQTLDEVVGDAIFEENHSELVLLRDINIYSMCEHHMVPFMGKCHIGYIPNSKVMGLSKLGRIAEMFSRRLQVQERLTKQICEGIMEAIQPKGVIVVIECQHMCMVMRGVEKSGSSTTTSSMLGCFRDDPLQKQEFYMHLNRRNNGVHF